MMLDKHEVVVTPSIGIAVHPTDGEDVDTLVKNADTAMYHAKDQGRNTFQFYADSMTARAVERLDMESKLRKALDRDEFVLFYQPQIELRSGKNPYAGRRNKLTPRQERSRNRLIKRRKKKTIALVGAQPKVKSL